MRSRTLVACLALPALSLSAAPTPDEGASPVGTIEMTVRGTTTVFEVREGPPSEGFTTGYSIQPRGEALVVGTSMHGWAEDSNEEIVVSVAFWKASLEHMCDPFANQVRYEGRRLRPGDEASSTCPPPEGGGRGGLSVNINLTEASVDEASGTVQVSGTFAGPLGRGEDALPVSEGRFEATLRSFDDLGGSR